MLYCEKGKYFTFLSSVQFSLMEFGCLLATFIFIKATFIFIKIAQVATETKKLQDLSEYRNKNFVSFFILPILPSFCQLILKAQKCRNQLNCDLHPDELCDCHTSCPPDLTGLAAIYLNTFSLDCFFALEYFRFISWRVGGGQGSRAPANVVGFMGLRLTNIHNIYHSAYDFTDVSRFTPVIFRSQP